MTIFLPPKVKLIDMTPTPFSSTFEQDFVERYVNSREQLYRSDIQRSQFGGDLYLDEGYLDMTEKDWLTSTNPNLMYSYLTNGTEQWLYKYGVTKDKLSYVKQACYDKCNCPQKTGDGAYVIAEYTINEWIIECDGSCACNKEFKSHLLREIFGNIFRPIVREKNYQVDPTVHSGVFQCAKEIAKSNIAKAMVTYTHKVDIRLDNEFKRVLPTLIFKEAWITPTITSIVKRIDEESDYGLMPILGDMLEEQGCDNKQVLDHCRACNNGKGACDFHPHVKGCWVLQLLGEK